VDSKVVGGKVAYNKNVGNRKTSSEKVGRFSVDFSLSLLLSFTKSYKKHFGIYFLESH